jgi:hypothetical protein
LGGFATSNVRFTANLLTFLRYLPPWRWWLRDEATAERVIRWNIVQGRIVGALIAVIGLVDMGSGIAHWL